MAITGRPRTYLTGFLSWRWRDYALLAALSVLISAANVAWRLEETRPPDWDMGRHLGDSIAYLRRLQHLDLKGFLTDYHYYPPFISYVVDPFYLVFGTEMWVAVLANALWVALLAWSTYGIGRVIWSPMIGLLATVFLLATPMFVGQFKRYMLDAPLSAIVALAIYLLILNQEFSNRRLSIVLGVVMGCGMLAKWTFPMVLGLPLAYALGRGLWLAWRSGEVERAKNAAISLAITAVIAGPWYLTNAQKIYNNITVTSSGRVDPPVWSMASNVRYFWLMVDHQLYVVPFVLFLVGVGFLFFKREALGRQKYLLLLILGTYVLFTFVQNKNDRYTMPMLVGVAMIAVYWLSYVKTLPRLAVSSGIIAYSVVAFVAMSFGIGFLDREDTFDLGGHEFVLYLQRGGGAGPPVDVQWYQAEVFQAIHDDGLQPRTVFYDNQAGDNPGYFSGGGIRFYTLKYDLTLVTAKKNPNYILIRDKQPPTLPAGFELIEQHVLPNKNYVVVLRRVATLDDN
ncbi:MAG TPA: glycosyltransferase family 39 protein [Dehalococcoidia bacterium]|nr:glycosyltransferase family 39 protein [Dehalococcoidia bacterium]